VLIVQAVTDPADQQPVTRYLAFVPQAKLQLLPNLSHVPISDDPALIASLIVDFAAAESPLAA